MSTSTLPPFVAASLSRAISSKEKYCFCSQMPIKFWIFWMCFGHISKSAALATSAGRTTSHRNPNFLSPFLTTTWKNTSLST